MTKSNSGIGSNQVTLVKEPQFGNSVSRNMRVVRCVSANFIGIFNGNL